MRKRSRETDNDIGEDFFPLSKRINSLQISGEFTFLPNAAHPVNSLPIQSLINQTTISIPQQESQPPPYNPELDLEQNPHYFYQNKNLYELYMQRQLRLGKNV